MLLKKLELISFQFQMFVNRNLFDEDKLKMCEKCPKK